MKSLGLGLGLSGEAASAPVSTSAVIQNVANTTVTDQGGGVYRVTKSAGGTGFNAAAASATGFAGDFTLSILAGQGSGDTLIGVNDDPLTTNSYPMDYSYYFTGVGSLSIWEGGADTGVSNSYTTSTTYWIGRVGTTLTYRKGADFATATVLKTVNAVSSTLYFDCSINGVGEFFDVRMA